MPSRRGVALLVLGLVLGTMLVTPAGAHVSTSMTHLWSKHLRPLAVKVFYTKSQSDARYYKKSDSDARYYTKSDSDARFAPVGQTSESGFQAYCARARSNPRSYPAELCDASLVVTLDSAGVVGEFTSLAIGTDGLPILSYRDATNGDLKILHCGNAACTAGNQATAVDTAGNVGSDTSLAIGADGLPVVSYRDATNEELKVLHCGNPTCTSGNDLTPVDTGFVGYDTSLAVGADGQPVVSYLDGPNGDLKVLHCGNAACTSGNQATVVDPGPVVVATDTSVATGADGLPVVSYYDSDDGDLRILHCGNAACTAGNQATSVDTVGWVGEFSSLAIGTDGLPVVSYRDGAGGDLKVLHCGNAACTSGNVMTPVDQSSDPLGYDTSMAIGTDGFPVVSYWDGSNSDLKFLHCGNAACTAGNQAIAVDTAGTVGRHTSVAIGTDGLPVVSYHDETTGDLKFARPPVP